MESIIAQIKDKFNSLNKEGKTTLFLQKYRSKANNSFYLIVFILSIFIAFFMGRTVKFLENRPDFVFEEFSQSNSANFTNSADGASQTIEDVPTIVASKGGKKYYFVWCKGAENIKEKNKRFFKTEEAAQQAGYTLATACK